MRDFIEVTIEEREDLIPLRIRYTQEIEDIYDPKLKAMYDKQEEA